MGHSAETASRDRRAARGEAAKVARAADPRQTCFAFDAPPTISDAPAARRADDVSRSGAGRMAYFGGQAAETQVEAWYRDRGMASAARRWRGAGGEIDLIFRDGETVVFVEVKRAATHDRAIDRLSPRQVARIFAAAEAFLGDEPRGTMTEARFDVALVDGAGRISVLENAFV